MAISDNPRLQACASNDVITIRFSYSTRLLLALYHEHIDPFEQALAEAWFKGYQCCAREAVDAGDRR